MVLGRGCLDVVVVVVVVGRGLLARLYAVAWAHNLLICRYGLTAIPWYESIAGQHTW